MSSRCRPARPVSFLARLALGSFSAFVLLLVAGALPAFSFSSVGTVSDTTTVQLPQRLCSAPASGHGACEAVRLVTRQVSQTAAQELRAAGLARPAAVASVASGPAGGYSPAQLATAYGVNAGAATNQTVAIVDAYQDPSVASDLNAFDAHYGLPIETAGSFKVVSQTGGSVSSIPTDVGWAGEITLDVDAVRGLCHACKILLVEANSNSFSDLGAAVDEAVSLGATIVSNSYGGTESGAPDPSYDHPGVAILASTGDDGWYDWDGLNLGASSSNAPQVPASYNTVVGVGGTTLDLNPNSTRASESVWNDNGPYDAIGNAFASAYGITGGAAGSGCSALYTAQTWQRNVSGYGTLGCGATLRNGVDIAADADYFTGFDTYETTTSWCTPPGTDGNGNTCPNSDPGWQTFGGTSLASPLVAAMWGLAGGPGGVHYPAMTLYGHFQTAPSQLYDVTVGGTGACDNTDPVACGSFFGAPNPNTIGAGLVDCQWGASGTTVLVDKYQCNAEPGYDGVSGVGTPIGVNPFEPLSPTAVIQAPGTLTAGVAHVFSASGSSAPFPGDSITQYKWSWGDGSADTTTASLTASHTYASAGTKTVTLTVTDSDSSQNGGRTGSKSIQVSVQAATQTLTVATSGTGTGSVSSSPAGIGCGSACSHDFATGTNVTLTATPASGSTFTGWSGACSGSGTCSVTMSQARSVTAEFTLGPAAPCVVPKLKGKTVKAATAALANAHCALGKVTKKFSKVKKGRVISQKPAPGTHLSAGAKVALVVSKGKRP